MKGEAEKGKVRRRREGGEEKEEKRICKLKIQDRVLRGNSLVHELLVNKL